MFSMFFILYSSCYCQEQTTKVSMFSTIKVSYLSVMHRNSWILNSMWFKATSEVRLQVSSYSERGKGKKIKLQIQSPCTKSRNRDLLKTENMVQLREGENESVLINVWYDYTSC